MANANSTLVLVDSRRLTGKNLLWDQPGAIIDARVAGINKQVVVEQWGLFSRRLLDELGWQAEGTCSRIYEDGISVAISAPMDALYTACAINEAAWVFTCAELLAEPLAENFSQAVERLRLGLENEENLALRSLINQARQWNIPWLSDDEAFSLGHGASAQVWPLSALPDPDQLDWQQFKAVPVVLVTGTNGKSTSVRILARMVKESGKCCGMSSTDFIRVGEQILDYGDYSGPGGARILLRHPDTEAAILEVARGGILRRGLPVEQTDAALITNIAEDHMGQYGINTLADLAKAKAVVAKALGRGQLVVNGDDEQLVSLAPELHVNICWFSLNKDNPVVREHRAKGGAVCFLDNGQLVYADEQQEIAIIAVNDIPMTLNGAARHNIHNALGAIGIAKCLGLTNQAIATALRQFSSSVDDNPGRGNQFEVNGAKVILDFAHNVHGIEAMAMTIANMPAKRKFIMLSMAGDRSDRQIQEATHAALAIGPDVLVAADVQGYLRGRNPGEIPRMIADTAIAEGLPEGNIIIADSPYAGAQRIVKQLQAADLALLLALADREKIVDLLRSPNPEKY